MKKVFFPIILTIVFLNVHCKKTGTVTDENDIPASVIARVQSLNLSTVGLQKMEGGYLAEQDIFLSNEFLNSDAQTTHYTTAHEDHYRTSNLVTGLPRTISVRYAGTSASISNAINTAIARYNALPLSFRLRFQRIATPANITVNDVSGVPYMVTAGYPSGGNPFGTINFNTAFATWSASTLATIFAHELGHCIGFGHTDVVDNVSCVPGAISGGIPAGGLILIPGTPSLGSGDPNSWMMRCIANGVNRPFTVIDRTALDIVY